MGIGQPSRANNIRRIEAEQLASIGAAIQHESTMVAVRIPVELAERAMRAWRRDDIAAASTEPETATTTVPRQLEATFPAHHR